VHSASSSQNKSKTAPKLRRTERIKGDIGHWSTDNKETKLDTKERRSRGKKTAPEQRRIERIKG